MKKETKTRLPLAPKPAPHPRKNHIKTTQNTPRLVRHPHSCTAKNAPKRKPANYPQNSASPNSGVLAQGSCTRDGFFDAKTKLCATQKPANYRKKRSFLQFWHTALVKQETGVQSQNSANAEFWSFCTRLLVKHEFPDAKAKLCATKNRFWHL